MMERPIVSALLASAFPKGRFIRKERHGSWIDQLDLGWVRFELTIFPPDAFHLALSGVRTGIDGSSTVLWALPGTGEEQLKAALLQMRAELLGLANGIVQITGRSPVAPSIKDLMV